MYLIFALVFCALLVVALGVVLFVSLTSDSPDPAAAPAEEEQSGAQAPGGNLPTGLNPSVRAPSVTSPSVQAPTATAPSVSGSGVSSGSLSAPSVTAPSVSAPSVSTPSVSTPRLPSGQIPSATAAPQASTQASESSGTPFLALIIILSVLLVIAVGAAVYFALRRA
jgi:cobalamin biosynthesis Mg chelatase CobN